MQLDTFVRFAEEEHPDLYSGYTFLRKRKTAKTKTGTLEAEPTEIVGTVTDSVTGYPIANATINIVDYNLIETTDTDGCYTLDELEADSYLVHCYAPNYQVPEAVSVTLAAGESLVVNFALTPVSIIANTQQ
jgi:hypothetical protein